MKDISQPGDFTRTLVDYNEADEKLIVRREADVEPVIEANKAAYNAAPETGRYRGDGFHKVMSIPFVVIEQIANEHGLNWFDKNHKAKILAILRGPEYRHLVTMPGKF